MPATTPRLSPVPASVHGLDNRGIEAGAIPGGGYGRYGRMFDFFARPITDDILRAVATAMIKPDKSNPITQNEPTDENPTIPSGYTYFGQFVDHDISLDPTPLSTKSNDLAALEDFRTPSLDLDCLYGRGPDDQPYMYTDGLHLRTGKPLTAAGATKGNPFDVLRLDTGGPLAPAILGDKRNDENRIVAQMQALFIAFHNKVVDDQALIAAAGGDFSDGLSRFRTAAQVVRWHYQWLVINDFLPRILDSTTLPQVLGTALTGGTPNTPLYDHGDPTYAYMPVEFSGAAYRYGHSQVRPGYSLNNDVGNGPNRIPIFSRDPNAADNLNGFGVPLPPNYGIDWAFFLDGLDRGHVTQGFVTPQMSYRIDANLVDPLADLPEFFASPSPLGNLAYRNLARGANNLRLPSGEQVANALGLVPLTPDVLWAVGSKAFIDKTMDMSHFTPDLHADIDEVHGRRLKISDNYSGPGKPLNGNTPLWYYILREAEYYGYDRAAEGLTALFGGQHLGPVGSRIVAETFVGLLWRNPQSYLRRWPLFAPMIPAAGAKFILSDVVRYAL